jgi:hypothetical protein
MDSPRLSTAFPYDTLIAHANAEHAAAVQHPLDALRVFAQLVGPALLPEHPVDATPIDAARTYADLRRGFNELALRQGQIPLDPGP